MRAQSTHHRGSDLGRRSHLMRDGGAAGSRLLGGREGYDISSYCIIQYDSVLYMILLEILLTSL